MNLPAPGWFPDPWQQGAVRWWDGTDWTGYHAGVPIPERLDAERRAVVWLRRGLPLQPISVLLSLGFGAVALRTIVRDFDLDDPSSLRLPSWLPLVNLFSVLGIVVLVLQLLWLLRAAEAARSLGLPLRREPGLTSAGWIIPIVNLWWPYRGMRDLFPDAPRPGRRIGWWWGCYLAGSVLGSLTLVGAFLSAWAHAALIAVAIVPTIVATVLQWQLVGDALAGHEVLAGVGPGLGSR